MYKIYIVFFLFYWAIFSQAQAQFTHPTTTVNGVILLSEDSAVGWGIFNSTNDLHNVTFPLPPNRQQGRCKNFDGGRGFISRIILKNILKEVFPLAKRQQMLNERICIDVYIRNTDKKAQEVFFDIHKNSLITPQEIVLLESKIKLLVCPQPPDHCQLIDYLFSQNDIYFKDIQE